MSNNIKPKVKDGQNRLIFEKSPYLLQHSENPVDWYPWGPEAFEKAKQEDKPVFLSIGYSTCHWCHVMAHESFEDAEVAKLLNEVFVCVKVDREERPDIDSVYMTVCQIMTGSGGWPLTIIMTPDKKPFFAATYIPRESRFGRAGMLDLIPKIKELWTTKRNDLFRSAELITSALKDIKENEPGRKLDVEALKSAYKTLSLTFDKEHGGFGTAPKFPTPHNLLFLLRYWNRSGDKKALEMAEKTLRKMRMGGIYDQIGYGFHRYSADSHWLVPHFEKMLYDQALLAMAYTEAWQATGNYDFERTAREIFDYVLRDMTAPDGGFYTAEDADSEGVEGKFYQWKSVEVRDALPRKEADLIINFFNMNDDGNFGEEASGLTTGGNILYITKTFKELSSETKIPENEIKKIINSSINKLFTLRDKRIHPHKDDKILTDWNGLMIAALARAGRVFNDPKLTKAAKASATFILKNLSTHDGRLLHRYRDGQPAITGLLDDYAFLTWGLIDLYETTFDVSYLKKALELNKNMIDHFWDKEQHGFFSTADYAEPLLTRQKQSYDGAIPSGNSVAMLNLILLARITANSEFEKTAVEIGQAFSESITQSPSGHTQLMNALDFALGPSYEVVIAGNSGGEDTQKMLQAVNKYFIPNKVIIFRSTDQDSNEIETIAPFTKNQLSVSNKATAYVCRDFSCGYPTTDISKMLELLNVK